MSTIIKLPKLVLTDIDGVWTDGGMYYDNNLCITSLKNLILQIQQVFYF